MKDRRTAEQRIREDYTVENTFAGGMGTVYIVFDPKYREHYAVKSPREGKVSAPGLLQRFIREAELWMKLAPHPNVVRALTVEHSTASTPLLFLEYVEGSNLRERLKDGEIPLVQAIDFAIQFCNGIEFAFETQGIVHRDIKPENVLITPEGLLKVTDFGLAASLSDSPETLDPTLGNVDQDDFRLTQKGAVFGTYPYTSLEQLRGEDNIGPSSDVYSFGVMLYEMLTGELPFVIHPPKNLHPGERGRYLVDAFIQKQTSERPALPSVVRPGIPKELDHLVMTCLENQPQDRFSNFGIIKERLIKIYEELHSDEENWSLLENAFINTGIANDEAGHYEEAIKTYSALLMIHPRSTLAWHNRANSMINLAEREEERPADGTLTKDPFEQFSKKLQLFQSALRCSECSIELDPEYDLAWNTKGCCLLSIGRFHRALESFDRALVINSEYVAAWYNRSTCLRRIGKHQEALDSYEKVLSINPRHVNALNGKGVCLAEIHRYDEALVCFDKALEIDPQHIQALQGKEIWGKLAAGNKDFALVIPAFANDLHDHFRTVLASGAAEGPGVDVSWEPRRAKDQTARELTDKAWGLKNLGNYDAALKHIEQAMALDPHYSTAYLQQGRILRNMSRYDEAIASFDRALQIDPDYKLVWLNKGLALSDRGRFEEALSLFDRYISAVPGDSAGWNNKGIVRVRQGQFAEAVVCYENALKIDPNDALAWANKASAHVGLDECELALETCERALNLNPVMEDALLQKGVILMVLARTKDAIEVFEKMTRTYPLNARGWLEKASCLVLIREQPELVLECCRRSAALGEKDRYRLSFNKGRALYDLKRYEEALNIFTELISDNSGDIGLWAQKAACLVQMDRYKEGADCYLEALKLDPGLSRMAECASSCFQDGYPEVVADLKRANDLLQAGTPEPALVWLNKAADACPHWWQIWDAKGAAYAMLGQLEKAADQYIKSLNVFSRNGKVLAALGICQLALNQPEKALDPLNKALEIDPTLHDARLQKALALRTLGRKDEALNTYTLAIESSPKLHQAWVGKAMILEEEFGNLQEALSCYERALELDPTSELVCTNMGLLLSKLARNEEALASFSRGLEINPQQGSLWYYKGSALAVLERLDESLVCLDRALEISPGVAQFWFQKALVLEKTEQREKALTCFDRGLELDPNNVDAWSNKGVVCGLLGRNREATDCFDRVLELDPSNQKAWLSNAFVLSKLGDNDKAISCYDRSLEIDPNNIIVWFNKAELLNQMKRYQQAVQSYDHVLGLNPNLAEAWFNKGTALGNSARIHDALKCFEEAQRLGLPQATQAIAQCRNELLSQREIDSAN